MLTKEERSKRVKERREKRMREGICPICGKQPLEQGRKQCEICKLKNRDKNRLAYKEKKHKTGYYKNDPKVADVFEAWDYGNRTFEEVAKMTGVSLNRVRFILPRSEEG